MAIPIETDLQDCNVLQLNDQDQEGRNSTVPLSLAATASSQCARYQTLPKVAAPHVSTDISETQFPDARRSR